MVSCLIGFRVYVPGAVLSINRTVSSTSSNWLQSLIFIERPLSAVFLPRIVH